MSCKNLQSQKKILKIPCKNLQSQNYKNCHVNIYIGKNNIFVV